MKLFILAAFTAVVALTIGAGPRDICAEAKIGSAARILNCPPTAELPGRSKALSIWAERPPLPPVKIGD